MTLAFTGGGTGGHIYPALAVLDAVRVACPEAQLAYLGSETGPECSLALEAGVTFYGLPARKLRRVMSVGTVAVAWSLYRGYRRARRVLADLRPSALLGTGGYVAAAAVIAAGRLRIPIVLHEQNAIAGRTNAWLARYARCVCLTFEDSAPGFGGHPTVVTGLPVRATIVSSVCAAEARAALGLAPGLFTVLVLGGSQGAVGLNAIVHGAVPLLPEDVQVLHQVGARSIDAALRVMQTTGNTRYRAVGYFDGAELPMAYRAAEVVVCRCGASTLAEVAANGLPAIYVPLPSAHADHQTANARAMVRRGAGVLAPQAELTSEGLVARLTELKVDGALLSKMGAASAGCAMPNAANDVARILLQHAGASGQ